MLDRLGGTTAEASRRRARASAVVVGGPSLGLLLARLLTQAGLGGVAVVDPAPVSPADVSVLGYHPGDVGRPRELAALAHLRHARADVRTRAPDRPDVVVLVESRVAVPFRSSGLMGEDVPHVSVVLRELDVVVGPAVRPGLDPCLRCLDLHRQDADACWPAIATQLAVAPVPHHDDATLATAAGTACARVTAVLDGVATDGYARSSWGRTSEVGPAGVAERRWAPHPACGCGAQEEDAPIG
ncbi:hypothetical protein C8046_06225 [Serinibacter arcticus]|uniref:THIF-type NAD/FAD binding fold domain-containing protein n=1 Tax=Serinibacter arcticus TaxID=1655435 RepID=A0A2U1ZTK7_9MICO|nr:hypothetical protein C8046_06225 [Serinibacter arcticus]